MAFVAPAIAGVIGTIANVGVAAVSGVFQGVTTTLSILGKAAAGTIGAISGASSVAKTAAGTVAGASGAVEAAAGTAAAGASSGATATSLLLTTAATIGSVLAVQQLTKMPELPSLESLPSFEAQPAQQTAPTPAEKAAERKFNIIKQEETKKILKRRQKATKRILTSPVGINEPASVFRKTILGAAA